VKRLLLVGLFVCLTAQGPRALSAQWRQAVPFGPVAALAGWADLPSARSTLESEVRIGRWHGNTPSPLLRVLLRDGIVRTEALLWWGSDGIHSSHFPSGAEVLCDSRKESPQTCIKFIAIPSTLVLPDLVTELLKIKTCETPRTDPMPPPVPLPTHPLTLQMQLSDRGGFREYRCVAPGTVQKGPGAALGVRLLNILSEVARSAGYN
jgi:hypothetical protein